jgi:D-aminoacyl-tRNA deacylase
MRAVCQRVSEARVSVGDSEVARIGAGLLVLLGVERGDDSIEVKRLAGKTARLRIFEDETGKFDRSVVDAGGSVLVVSQFTLIADTRKGNRPSFTNAAPPDEAEPLYEEFCAALAGEGIAVEQGLFGQRMAVALVNDGPVTIVLD